MSVVAVDVGTTGVRVSVFDDALTETHSKALPCPPDAPAPGWAEADPELWWDRATEMLRALADEGALADVRAVAVTGQAPTLVLVGDDHTVLCPAILWLDTRAELEATELGVPTYYLGPKLLWTFRHRHAALASAKWVLQSHAFVALRLTGEAAIDPSTAALCSPLFDLATLQWTVQGAAAAHVDPRKLPRVRAAHEIIGHVTADAAARTGLATGTPVVGGGGDFAASTLGAGVTKPGQACLMLGTAGNLLFPRAQAGTDHRLIHAHHVGARTFLSLGGTLCGGAIEWARRALADVGGAPIDFATLEREAADAPVGAASLLFLPYLAGERTPVWDADARGAFVGLGLEHDRRHMLRAVLEGIALSLLDCADAATADGAAALTEVIAANGAGKSALLRQILCDALGVPLFYAPDAGGTLSGTAALAALGAGIVADVDAIDALHHGRSRTRVRHEPDMHHHGVYRHLLEVRRGAYEGLRRTFTSLAARRAASAPVS